MEKMRKKNGWVRIVEIRARCPTRQAMYVYNVTLRRIRGTIVDVEKQ
jgi:hypothetical protein